MLTGNLQIKNGKYYAVLNLKVNGKRKPKWIPLGLPERGNKREAESLLNHLIVEYETRGEGKFYHTLGENGEYITLNNAFNANTITLNAGGILALVSLALIMVFYIICFKPKGLKGWALLALSTAVCALILFALASFFYYSQQWD